MLGGPPRSRVFFFSQTNAVAMSTIIAFAWVSVASIMQVVVIMIIL